MPTIEYGSFEWDDAKAAANLAKHGLARLLTVVHVERGTRVRVIRARHASGSEAQIYERRRF